MALKTYLTFMNARIIRIQNTANRFTRSFENVRNPFLPNFSRPFSAVLPPPGEAGGGANSLFKRRQNVFLNFAGLRASLPSPDDRCRLELPNNVGFAFL